MLSAVGRIGLCLSPGEADMPLGVDQQGVMQAPWRVGIVPTQRIKPVGQFDQRQTPRRIGSHLIEPLEKRIDLGDGALRALRAGKRSGGCQLIISLVA